MDTTPDSLEPIPPAASDADSDPRRRPPGIGWAVAGAVVVVAIGGYFGAHALASNDSAAGTVATGATNSSGAQGARNGRAPGTFGTITAITGTTLTVKDRSNATIRVETTTDTRITATKSVTATAIAVGDRITAAGNRKGTTVAATTVNDMGAVTRTFTNPERGTRDRGYGLPSGAGGGNFATPGGSTGFAIGTVKSVNENTIVVTGFDNTTTTITVSATTKITKEAAATLADLKVGQAVRVNGTTGSDGTITAVAINEGAAGFGGPGFGGRPFGGRQFNGNGSAGAPGNAQPGA
jgi:hypothetical protein